MPKRPLRDGNPVPASVPDNDATTETEKLSRRSVLRSGGTFLAGVMSGILGSYGATYLSALAPPSEFADSQASGAPIRTVVLRDRDQGIQGELWAYPGPVSQNRKAEAAATTIMKSYEELHDALYASGFYDVGVTILRLLIEGRRNGPVRIVDIEPRIVERKPPEVGTSLLGPGTQGTGPSVSIAINLDEDHPIARKTNPDLSPGDKGYFGASFFGGFSTELGHGEQEFYRIIARTHVYDVKWTLLVKIIAPGANFPTTIEIDNGGVPFRTAALQVDSSTLLPDRSRYSEIYVYELNQVDLRSAHFKLVNNFNDW